MEEEKLKASGVGSDNLFQSPFKGAFAADGSMRITLDRGLVHGDHHPSRPALHFCYSRTESQALRLWNALFHSLCTLLFVSYAGFFVSLRLNFDGKGKLKRDLILKLFLNLGFYRD